MADRPLARFPVGSRARTMRHVDRGDGWTLAMELLTATFFWGGVGWLLDGWLATGPVLMALGFVLGNGLGIYLIWVRSQERFVREHEELLARRGRGIGGARAGTATPDGGERTDAVGPIAESRSPASSDDHG